MKLALIALVSCMALSVKSVTYMGGVTTPETHATNWYNKSLLPNYANRNVPVLDVQSTDLICRSPDMTAEVAPYSMAAGKTIRVTFATEDKGPYANIDPVGPCSFWLAPLASKGVGKVWSKIHEYANDGKSEKSNWCSAELSKKGYFDFVIPADITPGKYILRSELINILAAGTTNYADFTSGPEFYSSCLVLDITGSGTAALKTPVSILEAYKSYYKTPLFPKGTKDNKFAFPGPAPYTTGLI
ncbi:hypothetical protein GGI09_002832 [Coemansia sp. S100]|nr:hypothetical protein GGI09_002832 [Coemansia sp. S100]